MAFMLQTSPPWKSACTCLIGQHSAFQDDVSCPLFRCSSLIEMVEEAAFFECSTVVGLNEAVQFSGFVDPELTNKIHRN